MYAQRHRLRFCEFRAKILKDHPPNYSKFAIALSLFADVEAVIFIDADAFFLDVENSPSIVATLEQFPKSSVIWTRDGGNPINSGVFIARNSSWTKRLFKRLTRRYSKRELDEFGFRHDQHAIREEMKILAEDFDAHTTIVDNDVLQTVAWRPASLRTFVGLDGGWPWKKPLIAHVTFGPGRSKRRKYATLLSYNGCEMDKASVLGFREWLTS